MHKIVEIAILRNLRIRYRYIHVAANWRRLTTLLLSRDMLKQSFEDDATF